MDNDILLAWDKNQEKLRAWIATVKCSDFTYKYLLENTIRVLFGETEESDSLLDYRRITEICSGDGYTGTLVFVICGSGYSPDLEDHWYTSVYYGSCSGCDTLIGILDDEHEFPSEDQIQQYWTLCLHMAQKMKRMIDGEA